MISSTFQKRLMVFLSKGPGYLATYGSWRALRMLRSMRELYAKPSWNTKGLADLLGFAGSQNGAANSDGLGKAQQQYFIRRPTPQSHVGPAGLSQIAAQVPESIRKDTIALADDIINGQFSYRGSTVTFDKEIDWAHQPEQNIDWTWDLNRHYCLMVLAKAYAYSDDGKYVRRAVKLLKSWMNQNPPKIQSKVWRPFEVSTRLGIWIWIFFIFLNSDYFARFGLNAVLMGIYCQAGFLKENLEYHIQNNHLLLEAKTLAMTGLLFPEFTKASKWYDLGIGVVWKQFADQVCPDGVHAERSTQYHFLVGSEMWELFRLLQINGKAVPEFADLRFKKMIEFARAIVKPDQTIPLFGDSSRSDEHIRFDVRWAASGMAADGPYPAEETFWLLQPEDVTNNEPQELESVAFSDGGYFIMRDQKHRSQPYLAFDCGPFGHIPVPSHGHADALSFELCANGETLITDCGAYRYHAPAHYQNYFRGVRAHNTVMIDKSEQSALVGSHQVEKTANTKVHRWLASDEFDLVVGSHDGYKRLANSVIHERAILFLKPDYWLVLDRILGDGEHQLEWFYHFMPDAEVALDAHAGQATTEVRQAGLLICPVSGNHIIADLKKGDENEPQGWVSLESGRKEPASVLTYRCKKRTPFHFGVILKPYSTSSPSAFSLRKIHNMPNVFSVSIQDNDINDLICCTHDLKATNLQIDDWQADASLMIVRSISDGIYKLSLVDAVSVKWREHSLFETPQAVPIVNLVCDISQDRQKIDVVKITKG